MSVLPDDPRLSAPACLKLGSPAMVHENPWFSVMDRGGYYTVEHHTPQVVVLPVVAGHGVVMVRAHRPVIADCPLELPAGGFLAGESPRQAAARELAEETGILVDAPERFVPQSPIAGLPNRDPLLLHILRVDLNHDEFLLRKPHDHEIASVELIEYAQIAHLLCHSDIYVAVPMAILGRFLLGLEPSIHHVGDMRKWPA